MNLEHQAIIYAAQKLLERELVELPPGFKMDLSGKSITIKFSEGTTITRDTGINGDGKILKKATQNLYGYAVWALLIERLMRFHQWGTLKNEIIKAVKASLKYKSNVRESLAAEKPFIVEVMNELQQDLPIPARAENTPREVITISPPTITMR